jgi:hypothetical protein
VLLGELALDGRVRPVRGVLGYKGQLSIGGVDRAMRVPWRPSSPELCRSYLVTPGATYRQPMIGELIQTKKGWIVQAPTHCPEGNSISARDVLGEQLSNPSTPPQPPIPDHEDKDDGRATDEPKIFSFANMVAVNHEYQKSGDQNPYRTPQARRFCAPSPPSGWYVGDVYCTLLVDPRQVFF